MIQSFDPKCAKVTRGVSESILSYSSAVQIYCVPQSHLALISVS